MTHCAQTARTYSRSLGSYLLSPLGGKNRTQQNMLRQFARFLGPTARVLDLGCGSGTTARLLLEDSPLRQVFGLDLSAAMIKRAKRTEPRGHFLCRDLRYFAYRENVYDAVILASVVFHLQPPELRRLAERLAYTLKPDGLLFLNYWSGEYSGFKRLDFADRTMLIHYYERDDIAALMREHSFGSLWWQQHQFRLQTALGPEEIFDCYHFFHSLKDVTMVMRMASPVTSPLLLR